MKVKSARIENFKSLGDVELTFRDLTILVGPNGSGKSNCLEALSYLSNLLAISPVSQTVGKQRLLRYDSDRMFFTINVEDENNYAEYSVSVKLKPSNSKKALIASENLKVNGIGVIEIVQGKGKVSDETGDNSQPYQSDPESINSLALRTAGNFGNRPFTKELANYIREWKFYNIEPDQIRQTEVNIPLLIEQQVFYDSDNEPNLGNQAERVKGILNYWANNEPDKFKELSEELKDCLNISLKIVREGKDIVRVIEANGKKMPLVNMSDGTLRLIAYFILLYQSEIPPLIGIEEPERNFHPGILKDIASIMRRLSKKTQVVMTTHSSQLLDCLNLEEISSDISVIVLSKKDDAGTKASLLEKLAENRDDLAGWMDDFGLGSAIYHSHLIEEILGI
jgi:predicted ATPase